jgi:hypothetical protein
MDPPAHDRLRRLATSHFEQTEAVRPDMLRVATDHIDRMRGKHQIDLVDEFAYPLPVTVIELAPAVPVKVRLSLPTPPVTVVGGATSRSDSSRVKESARSSPRSFHSESCFSFSAPGCPGLNIAETGPCFSASQRC